MPTINTSATGHGSRSESYSDGSVVQYNVFPETTNTDKKRLENLRRAVKIIDNMANRLNAFGPCNRHFKSLPKGMTFSTLWADKSIFIDFSPSNTVGFYGATHSNDKDVAVTAWCLDNKNRWMVAATIVHEFGHIGGAPGGSSHSAEKAVDACYFYEQYDPLILGSLQDIEAFLRNA